MGWGGSSILSRDPMQMTTQRTIGELAREAGIAVSTLRYYEREGLLTPAARSDGNYRLYGPDGLERLRFIRSAQAAGFTIVDIKTLLQYRDGAIAPCREVSQLVEERLTHIRERMREFRHVDRVLSSFLNECRRAEREAGCHVMEKLHPAVTGAGRPPAARPKKK